MSRRPMSRGPMSRGSMSRGRGSMTRGRGSMSGDRGSMQRRMPRKSMFVLCDVCDVTISTAEEFDRHMVGKRHQSRLQNYKERKEVALRSIFVKNFPPRTSEYDLKNHFNTFGPISKVIMDEKCKNKMPQFAIIEYSYQQSADNALNYPSHILNSTKLLVKKRDFKELSEEPYFPWQKKKQEEELPWNKDSQGPGQNQGQEQDQSQGYGQGQQHGNQQYQQQGGYPHQQYQEGYNQQYGAYGGQEYSHQQTYSGEACFYQDETWCLNPPPQHNQQQIQQQNQQQGGSKMSKKRKKGLGFQEQKTEPKVKREDVLPLPITVEEFTAQMAMLEAKVIQIEMSYLADMIQVTSQELQHRYTICKILEDCLSPFFPGVAISQFGSSVNGFGIKGCDMDVFVDLSKLGIPCRSSAVALPYTRDFRFFKKTSGPLSKEDCVKLSAFEKAKLISRILLEHTSSLSNCQVIPSNRCPVVRFTHTESSIKCDLSVDNRLALQNTRLLQTLSLYDPRVRPLVYTIRYWAKVKEIAGNPQAGPRLSNYALTLMVVYYLNNCKPRVLPTVAQMAELCATERTIINKWDCSFVAAQFLPPTMNTQTSEELLAGFFKFYAEFDWHTMGLSTHKGESALIGQFSADYGMKTGFFNIQDPFVLDHNITLNVNEKVKENIIREFIIAAAITAKWSLPENDSTKCLSEIFKGEVPTELPEPVLKAKIKGSKALGEYQFILDLKEANLSRYLTKEFASTGNLQLAWCHRMCHFVYEILERVLVFDCEIVATNVDGQFPRSRDYTMPTRSRKQPKKTTEQDEGASSAKKIRPSPEASSDDGNPAKSTDEDTNAPSEGPQGSEERQEEDMEEDDTNYLNADVYLDMDMHIYCRVWAERKKFTQAFKERGYVDSLELEQAVSEKLYYEHFYRSRHPIVEYRIVLTSVFNPDGTASVLVDFRGDPEQKEYYCVFHYIKKFLTKAADKFFC